MEHDFLRITISEEKHALNQEQVFSSKHLQTSKKRPSRGIPKKNLLKRDSTLIEYFLFCILLAVINKIKFDEKIIYTPIFMHLRSTLFTRVIYGYAKRHEAKKYWSWWNVWPHNFY
jgi:hypothetical protein